MFLTSLNEGINKIRIKMKVEKYFWVKMKSLDFDVVEKNVFYEKKIMKNDIFCFLENFHEYFRKKNEILSEKSLKFQIFEFMTENIFSYKVLIEESKDFINMKLCENEEKNPPEAVRIIQNFECLFEEFFLKKFNKGFDLK